MQRMTSARHENSDEDNLDYSEQSLSVLQSTSTEAEQKPTASKRSRVGSTRDETDGYPTPMSISPHPRLSGFGFFQPSHSLAVGASSIQSMFPQEHKLTSSFSATPTAASPPLQGHEQISNMSLPLTFDMEPRTIEEMMGDIQQKKSTENDQLNPNQGKHMKKGWQ